MLVLGPSFSWNGIDDASGTAHEDFIKIFANDVRRNIALYFPNIQMVGANGPTRPKSPIGAFAGIYARTDAERGVWKAPTGLEAGRAGVSQLQHKLNDRQNGRLNVLGVNCLRTLPAAGHVVWGARTILGDDRLADTDNKYVPVRCLQLFLEESL